MMKSPSDFAESKRILNHDQLDAFLAVVKRVNESRNKHIADARNGIISATTAEADREWLCMIVQRLRIENGEA